MTFDRAVEIAHLCNLHVSFDTGRLIGYDIHNPEGVTREDISYAIKYIEDNWTEVKKLFPNIPNKPYTIKVGENTEEIEVKPMHCTFWCDPKKYPRSNIHVVTVPVDYEKMKSVEMNSGYKPIPHKNSKKQ